MENYNVISDIGGMYLTLQALLKQMPQDAIPLSLGDMNDRGPRSKEVIEFFKNNGKAIHSNHGHMMVDFYLQENVPGYHPYYEVGVWSDNGGGPTLKSYDYKLDRSHIEYLSNLPKYIETDNFFLSHAPLSSLFTPEQASELGYGFVGMINDQHSHYSLLWNRYVHDKPHPALAGKTAIFGHNSSDAIKYYTKNYPKSIKRNSKWEDESDKPFAICIDTTSAKVLTGIHLPTMEVYQQPYID